jgi:DNA-binding CsgD family transcriptional regulator
MDKNIKYCQRYFESRDQFKIPEGCVDYSVAESYIPFFRKVDEIEMNIILVFDFYKKKIFYLSERFFTLFGFDREKTLTQDHHYIRSRFHPDDIILNLISAQGNSLILSLPAEERKNYRIESDFRIMNESGNYLRLNQKDYYLELASNGMVWLNMKTFDFATDQDLERPSTYIIRNVKTNEIVFSSNTSEKANLQISEREKEILQLIMKGLSSKEIADKLLISINTVNNHRRSAMQKLGVNSSLQAVRLAKHLEILN